ncbi:MAG: DUF6531 domain-containing protein [Pyrinomonadaceae bacterium]
MLKRLLSLVLIYSFLILSVAGPTLAHSSSSAENKGQAAKDTDKVSCSSCAAKGQRRTLAERIDGLSTIGRTTQIQPLLPVHRSIFAGFPVNFVSTATGHLAFAVNDFGLSGSMPVVFQRVYSSDRGEDLGLGKGWSFLFDDRITIDGDAATLKGGDGSVVPFRADNQSGRFVLSTPEPQLHQSFDLNDDVITEQIAGVTRVYHKLARVYRLTQITDSNGNAIVIGFDAHTNLNRITGSMGTLTLEWSDGKDPRLLAVTDNVGRRVSFKQEANRLRAVTDAGGNHWLYEYSQGRLTAAFDPLGRTLLRTRYDEMGRVTEAGDGAGTKAYEYGSASATVSLRTLVTDPLGVTTIYEHNDFGALVGIKDEREQSLLQIDYNAANHPTRFLTQQDSTTNFLFDAHNRLIQSTATDGSSKAYTYDRRGRVSSVTENGVRKDYARDARGNIVTVKSNDPNENYRAAYDAHGRVLTIESAGHKTTNQYDRAGNQIAFTSEGLGRFRTDRDSAGRIVKESFPSGLTIRYNRNPRGMVVIKSDNHGGSVTFERDSSGALAGLVKSDNSWVRATRDQTGRIVALNSSGGKSRRFAYNSRGGLTDYTDSLGRHKRFNYDRRGRLGSILDDDGNKTMIDRDERGDVQRIVFIGKGWRYDYDRAGRLVAVRRLHGPFNKAGHFLSIGFDHSSALPKGLVVSLQGTECPFGPDPSFDASEQGWDNCWDPFGGFGGFGGGECDPSLFGAGFDPSMCTSYFGETPEQCIARHNRICQNARDACAATAVGAAIAATAACLLFLEAQPGAAVICVSAVYMRTLAELASCDLADQNCRLRIVDACRR